MNLREQQTPTPDDSPAPSVSPQTEALSDGTVSGSDSKQPTDSVGLEQSITTQPTSDGTSEALLSSGAPGVTAVDPAVQATRRIKNKIVGIMIAVGVFMVAGTLTVLYMIGRAQIYSPQDLITYTHDNVSFSYPKQWQAITDLPENQVEAAFGSSSSPDSATAVIVEQKNLTGLKSTDVVSSTQLAAMRESIKTKVRSAAFISHLKTNAKCASVDQVSVTDLPESSTLKGEHITARCTRSNDQKVGLEVYIGLAADNNIYSLEIDALHAVWQANEEVFTSMLNSFEVR